jgi:hypothetical protein
MELWAEIATISVAAISVIGAGIWRVGLLQATVLKLIQEYKDEVDKSIDDERLRTGAEFSILRREIGETMTAMRQKINEVEIWGRDNYVKKDTFNMVTDRITQSIEKLGNKIEGRIDKMDEKFDEIIKNGH